MRAALAWVVVVSVLGGCLMVGGCSFLEVSGPPRPAPRDGRVECTDSRVYPIADVVAAALGAGVAGAIALSPPSGENPGGTAIVLGIAGVGIVTAAIGTLSALYGFSKVGDCRRAKARAAGT